MSEFQDFSDLEPYDDHQVGPVLTRLMQSDALFQALYKEFPRLDPRLVKEKMQGITSIKEFQTRIMAPAVEYLFDATTKGLTVSGLDQLDPKQCHVFISNHRDIVLDSCCLGWASLKSMGKTMQMAIGSNLMKTEWVAHLFKLNKTVIVARGQKGRALLTASQKLSAYIGQLVTGAKDSLWIAQAEGRTKDGNDFTQSGLVKMLTLAGGKDWETHVQKLNIVPVSISYEYDPCDLAKARERWELQINGFYEKAPDEDLASIAKGLNGFKGRVHLAVGAPINQFWKPKPEEKAKVRISRLQNTLDRQIIGNYHLWPTNYIAADLQSGARRFEAHYNADEEKAFSDRLEKRLDGASNPEGMRKLILEMYANPVANKAQHREETNRES